MRDDRIGFVTGALAALALVGWMAGGVAAYEDAKPVEAKAACCAAADGKCGGDHAGCCKGHAAGGDAKSCCRGEEGKACHGQGASCCTSRAKADGRTCCRHQSTDGAAEGCGACCRHDENRKETRR